MSPMPAPRRLLYATAAPLAILLFTINSGCGRQAAPDPIPTPPLPNVPTVSPAETYTDTRHGFLITRPGGWSLERTDATEGVLLTLTSPDGAVSVRVVRDFPPPTADATGYARAIVEGLKLSLPGMALDQETRESASNGTPLYRARFTVPGPVPQTGELVVAVRTRDTYQEAFLLQATGPQPAYAAWSHDIRTAVDSFFLVALPPASATPLSFPAP